MRKWRLRHVSSPEPSIEPHACMGVGFCCLHTKKRVDIIDPHVSWSARHFYGCNANNRDSLAHNHHWNKCIPYSTRAAPPEQRCLWDRSCVNYRRNPMRSFAWVWWIRAKRLKRIRRWGLDCVHMREATAGALSKSRPTPRSLPD